MNYALKIKNWKLKIGLIILISLFLSLKSAPVAYAQGIDLGIYPPIFEVQTTAPTEVNVPLIIQNFEDNPVDLTISLKPFTASQSENGEIEFLEAPDNFPDPALFQKVKIFNGANEIKSITLSAKQEKELKLQIEIPADQQKGDYYFSVVFNSNPQNNQNSNSSGASAGIASNVLLTVGPIGKTQGIIEEFSSPFLNFNGPVPFTVKLRNTSDHYVSIKGDVIIKNLFGQSIGKVTLLPVNVLSNTIRRIPDSLQSVATPDKDYAKIKETVDKNRFPVAVWPEKFLLGPYTATLTLSMSDEGPVYQRQISFFAFPLEYLLALILIIGVVVYIIVRLRARLKSNL